MHPLTAQGKTIGDDLTRTGPRRRDAPGLARFLEASDREALTSTATSWVQENDFDRLRPRCEYDEAILGQLRLLVWTELVYTSDRSMYTDVVTKRLVDIDDTALDGARISLGTRTIKDTVNEALRQAGEAHQVELDNAISVLANADLGDRAAAWR